MKAYLFVTFALYALALTAPADIRVSERSKALAKLMQLGLMVWAGFLLIQVVR